MAIPDDIPGIEVRNLHRRFGDLRAVEGVSFSVPRGQVVGFVGANGAGKTTTMRILATLEYPTWGSAHVLGIDVVNHPAKVRRMLGWMPDSFGTYTHMTVVEYLDFYARALGYRGEERVSRIAEVMSFTDLTGLADRLTDKLSKGMGQRLCLGRALIHDPEVLILDEPAAGLDPKARVELKHLIRILAEEGKTILISSHILSELGEMCDTLLFIDNGRVVHHGTSESLKKGRDDTTIVSVRIDGDTAPLYNWITMSPHVDMIEEQKSGALLRIDSQDQGRIAEVVKRLVQDGIAVSDFHQEERNLEDAFIDILSDLRAEREAGESPVPPFASASAAAAASLVKPYLKSPPPPPLKSTKKEKNDLSDIPEPDAMPEFKPPPPPKFPQDY
ncbi:MAG: ABC transporter ATP-binding protein [Verrucomicrobia bacterium]|nr:ABC transporter ATP-binding protein [Verrucomicrobiota bacterium]